MLRGMRFHVSISAMKLPENLIKNLIGNLMKNFIADFAGEVVRGKGRGRELGFPTINVRLPEGEKMPIDHGVYVVRVALAGGALAGGEYLGALHYGPNATFGESQAKVEIFLLDFEGELYGEVAKVRVLKRLRDTIRFDSQEELSKQIAEDVRNVKN